MFSTQLVEKWKTLLDVEDLPNIKEAHKRYVVSQLLENTDRELRQRNDWGQKSLMEADPINQTSNVDNYDPVLISLIRRAMPNLIAYDIAGVQPMTGPTGLIFAMRSHYANSSNAEIAEAFYNEADTDFSGTGTHEGSTGVTTTANTGVGVTTSDMETNTSFAEMAFTIDKVTVTAQSRALKAEYSTELAQDLKAIHGLDAEAELSNILTAELLAEINREVVRTVYNTAKTGAQGYVSSNGTFDLDVDSSGRWLVEKFKGLHFAIEREANQIAKETRRGKGNVILCSSDVASALQMAGVLDYTPALNSNNLQVDDTGNTFVGVLNGRYRVYIDPYSTGDFCIVGYKGANPYDAGLFYCPYVPLQMVRAVGENSFQPKIGFKTRYGMVANPFSKGAVTSDGTLENNANVYYRRFLVANVS